LECGCCQSGRAVAITGPTVCHQSEGQTCESGSVPGSGWIPVKYINHTAPDPGCTRLTDHPNYETCVGNNETNTNATGNQSQTNATTTGNLTEPAVTASQPTTNESWRYNAGYLQGVQGAVLKTYHTLDFLQGYIKGTQQYWYNRGAVEGDNKLPKSSTDANYTQGYSGAIYSIQKDVTTTSMSAVR
jgi:hypothetical protein